MPSATQDPFELTLARPVTLPAGEHPALVHLWWRSAPAGERLVQVYVDDELYDVTADPAHRQMWLVLDRTAAHRIELLAVPMDQAWQPQADALVAWQPKVRDVARLAVLRDETLTVDTQVRVSVDGKVVNEGPLWPSDAHRGGFGALFGEGGFGFDAATGPGCGVGELGYGPLGADGTAWRWQRHDLKPGSRSLAVKATDRTGQTIAPGAMQPVMIDHLAPPASQLQIESDFTLHWS